MVGKRSAAMQGEIHSDESSENKRNKGERA